MSIRSQPKEPKQPDERPDSSSVSYDRATGAMASPCCRKCHLTSQNTCSGCGRTLMEIASWSMLTENQRKAVMKRISETKTGCC